MGLIDAYLHIFNHPEITAMLQDRLEILEFERVHAAEADITRRNQEAGRAARRIPPLHLDDAGMMPAPRAAALRGGYPQPMAVVALAPRAAAAAPELPDGRPEARP